MKTNIIYNEDCLEGLKKLPNGFVDCCITSPPYFGLRDYGVDGQVGLEGSPEKYVVRMVKIFSEVKRVLKTKGTLWLNIGDSYNGSKKGDTEVNKNPRLVTDTFEKKLWKGAKPKDLIGIPWMIAFALRDSGWYLRQDIIWSKPNPMPESVTDRCTKSHEYIFLLSKSKQYYFEQIKEPAQNWGTRDRSQMRNGTADPKLKHHGLAGIEYKENPTKNKRSVWEVTPDNYPSAHFATFPEKLIAPMIQAGCPRGGVVLDPFIGSGTTARVAKDLGRGYIGYELNPDYIKIAEERLRQGVLL